MIISCSDCTLSARTCDGHIYKCGTCERNTCQACFDKIWKNPKWVKVCKICAAINYLENNGYVISKIY